METSFLAMLCAVVAVAAAVMALAPAPRINARSLADRARDVQRRGAPRAQALSSTIGIARGLLQRLRLLRRSETRKVADQLAQAGWRSRDAVVVYLAVRVGGPVVMSALCLASVALVAEPAAIHWLGAVFVGIAAGGFGPTVFLRNVVQKRRALLQRALPDALDLLVICAEAGLGFDAALTRVAREMARTFPVLADELSLTVVELRFLPDRREALENLARRVDLAAFRGLITTLIQTERYGTPLAQALRVLAAESRDNRMLRAEAKAARLPATLTVPMIVFILPALFVVLVGPAAIQVVRSFH